MKPVYFTPVILRRAATQLGMRFGATRMWGKLDDHEVRLDVWDVGNGHRVRTRIEMTHLGLGLWIRPEHLLDKLWDAFGVHDIRIGDDRIDAEMRIESDYPDWFRKHMNSIRLRDCLNTLLDHRFVVYASDDEVRTEIDVRSGDSIAAIIQDTLALVSALQTRGETPLQTLDIEGLHAQAAVASGSIDGVAIQIVEVAGPSGSMLEIRAKMPWTTDGLDIGHRTEVSARIGDPILDLTVSIAAADLDAARHRLCVDAVRAPLAAIIHGRGGSIWRGDRLITFADNCPTDLANAVEEVLELATGLRGPAVHDDDARTGAADLGDAVLEASLGGSAHDDQIPPADAEGLADASADRSDQEPPGLAD